MSGFDPGPGWREVQYGADLEGHEHITWDSTGRAGGAGRMWVREAPVPPLPTEPGYYVDANGSAWHLDDDGEWDDTFGNPVPDSDGPKRPLTRYEPRAVTAKAVLDRIQQIQGRSPIMAPVYDVVAREFGADA